MSFLTDHMQAMLDMATDPEEIELRTKVLNDQLAMEADMAAKREGAQYTVLAAPADNGE